MSKVQFFTLCQNQMRAAHMTLKVEIPEGVTQDQVVAEIEENAEELWDNPESGFECGATLITSYESEDHIEPMNVYHRSDCIGME